MGTYCLNLTDRYGKKWTRLGSCAVSGYIFWQDKLLSGLPLAEWFSRPEVRADLAGSLRTANGSFHAVYQEADRLWAAVDRLRSLPLFYAVEGGSFYLSDDAYWVREQTADTEMDVVSAAEFHSPGYVTGRDTLFPAVRQLQAGEGLEVHLRPTDVEVNTVRYYRYLHHDPLNEDLETFTERNSEMLDGVARRLIESVDGRTIVIPLSGGYDSRLVALLLKTHGYDRVICFSYGREGPRNRESRISKQVAEQLGYPWYFVPYSREMWLRLIQSDERQASDRYADNLVSLPHLQDWPAVRQLQREGRLPDDCVFAPGHSGDFLAGSHMVAHRAWVKGGSTEDMLRAIRQQHYSSFREASPPGNDLWSEAAARILSCSGDRVDGTVESVLDACDSWDWQERQAKYIVNSVRVYEYFGYEWRIPLFDAEMMALWERAPLSDFRLTLYGTYVLREGERFGLSPKARQIRVHRVLAKALLRRLRLEHLGRRIKNVSDYHREDALAFYGAIPPEQLWAYGSIYNPYLFYHARTRIAEIQREVSGG